jgi:hypothetical protein
MSLTLKMKEMMNSKLRSGPSASSTENSAEVSG